MRPNAHAITNRRLGDMLLLAVLGGAWLLCVGCEERGSTRAQALGQDIVLRFHALDPPTLIPEMMPLEPLLEGLHLGTSGLSEFEPPAGTKLWEFGIEQTDKLSLSYHFEQPGAFMDGQRLSWGTLTSRPLSHFELIFARPAPEEERVLTALKLYYDKQPFCDELEGAFALTSSHGLCSERLFPGGKFANSKYDDEKYPRWVFCAKTPNQEYLVRVECEEFGGGTSTHITYTLVKRPEGERGGAAVKAAAAEKKAAAEKAAAEKAAAEKAAAEKAVADKAAADKAAAEKSTPTPTGYVRITAGSFKMGSPSSEDGHHEYDEIQHEVTLTRDYFMKAAEVTQGEWRALMGNNPSDFTNCGDSCPVENVSWYDGLAYSNALSASEGLEECYDLAGCSGTPGEGNYTCPDDLVFYLSCEGYRLPTETEWEYAARAGTQTRFSSGDDDSALMRVAWYSDNSDSKTHPVGEKDANAWGLYDMHGNVWEWAWDWHNNYLRRRTTDPIGSTGSYRVGRGGSWYNGARLCRAAARAEISPSDRSNKLGFRPVRSSP